MNLFTDPEPQSGNQREALTVSRLLRRMRNVLEIEVGEVWVEGEVSNLRKQASGHYYFSLKDDGGQLACALFGARRKPGSEALEDGAKVRVFGEVTIYEARGTAQLVVREVEAAGAGELQARFEALKRKLEGEGLFAEERKKLLPKFPRRIGMVTSGRGAALQDMINVLSRRAPWVTVFLCDVQVQGKGAERGIARAIQRLGNWKAEDLPECDVIIVARGGGSLEDLWNFNEEIVARAIADCGIPLVSAVGHEIDFTIADFVSDVRAPTPSAAAELVVPDGKELQARLARLGERVSTRVREGLERREEVLKYVGRGILSDGPEEVLREPVTRVDELGERLQRVLETQLKERTSGLRELGARWRSNRPGRVVERQDERLQALRNRLEQVAGVSLEKKVGELQKLEGLIRALGPESAFERGFSITMNSEGQVVRSAKEVRPGDRLETMMKGGVVASRVE